MNFVVKLSLILISLDIIVKFCLTADINDRIIKSAFKMRESPLNLRKRKVNLDSDHNRNIIFEKEQSSQRKMGHYSNSNTVIGSELSENSSNKNIPSIVIHDTFRKSFEPYQNVHLQKLNDKEFKQDFLLSRLEDTVSLIERRHREKKLQRLKELLGF